MRTMMRQLLLISIPAIVLLALAGCYTQLGTQEDEGIYRSSTTADDTQASPDVVDPMYNAYMDAAYYHPHVGFAYYYPSYFPSDMFAYESATMFQPASGYYGDSYGPSYGYGGYYNPPSYGYGGSYAWPSYGYGNYYAMGGYYSPLGSLPSGYYYYHHAHSASHDARPMPGGETAAPTGVYGGSGRQVGDTRFDAPATGGGTALPTGMRRGTSTSGGTSTEGTATPAPGVRTVGSQRGGTGTERSGAPAPAPTAPAPGTRSGSTRGTVKPAAVPPQQPPPKATSGNDSAGNTQQESAAPASRAPQQQPTTSTTTPPPQQQPAPSANTGRQPGTSRGGDTPPRP